MNQLLLAVLLLASASAHADCFGKPATIKGNTPRTWDGDGHNLHGTGGPDVMVGGVWNDHLIGYTGNDRLCGTGGADVINGGSGYDRCKGGDGSDYIINCEVVFG